MKRLTSLAFALPLLSLAATAAAAPARVTPMTPDVVESYDKVRPEADFVRRVEMIPMRDGTKLYTVIVMRKGVRNAPMLITRTPYDAKGATSRTASQKGVEILPAMETAIANRPIAIVVSSSVNPERGCADAFIRAPRRGAWTSRPRIGARR